MHRFAGGFRRNLFRQVGKKNVEPNLKAKNVVITAEWIGSPCGVQRSLSALAKEILGEAGSSFVPKQILVLKQFVGWKKKCLNYIQDSQLIASHQSLCLMGARHHPWIVASYMPSWAARLCRGQDVFSSILSHSPNHNIVEPRNWYSIHITVGAIVHLDWE